MDCLTPTQQKAIPHGTSLTIEGVLELTEGGQLGPAVEGFEDTATESIPMELRSADERRRLQLEAMAETTIATTTTSLQGPEDHSQSLFLEAQSLATMKEIKQLIKRRKQEAEAAWQAQLAAERKAAAKLEAATRGDSHDNGDQGSGGPAASYEPTKLATPPGKRRIVRSATAPWRARAPTGGRWGQVKAQDDDEDEDEASTPKAVTNVEPEVAKPGLMDLVFGEALDTPVSKVLAPLGSTDVVVSDDEDDVTLGPEEAKRARENRDRMSYDEDLFPSMKDAAVAQDVLDDQDSQESYVLTYDDDWTLPTEEWLAYFTRDYGGPSSPPGLESFSSVGQRSQPATRPTPVAKTSTPAASSKRSRDSKASLEAGGGYSTTKFTGPSKGLWGFTS